MKFLEFKRFVKLLFFSLNSRIIILSQVSQQSGTESLSNFFYQQPEYSRDCKEIQQRCSAQNSSRVHLIKPDGLLEPFQAHCDDEWTIIQRRVEDFVEFNRGWTDYRDGFGFLNTNFWIGNKKLAYLTNQNQYELMIYFEMETGVSGHVIYKNFRISDEFNSYKLTSVGDLTGNLGLLLTSPPNDYSDCYDLQQAGYTDSGEYIVNPAGWYGEPFTISCNMDIDEGGWTVFQRRIDGTEPFNLDWNSYKEGFGSPSREFWMGNDKLAFLTNQKDYELRVDLINMDTDDSSSVEIKGAVTLPNYDALRYHYDQAFSTIDRKNDGHTSFHCASNYQSAWWYKGCHGCDLNRPYTDRNSPHWYNLHGNDYIEYSEMKIRPVERT